MRAHEFILNEKRRKKRKARSVIGPYYGYYYGLGTTTDSAAEGGDGGGEGIAEGKMAELDMDLEDPEITDRQFEKMYGMTRKEARELFSKTNMWDFPDFRDPDKPLHEQGATKDSVIFLNDNTVIVGQEHGKSLELSPKTSKQVRAIAKKYGAWYEGNGMDRKFTKGIIDEYQGSWDDDLLSPSIKGYPYPFLYVLFSNIEANDTVKGKIGSDPKVTIFNRILDTQPSTNYFPDRTFSSEDLTKFLKSVSQGPYDFVKMSQAPATEKNVQKFFKIGEKLMWPENWEEYPNNAGQLAKRVNDLRDKFLASRKSGVYVVGSSHLMAVKNFANKQDVSESLDSPYSYHWEEGDFGDLNAYAQLSDNTVLDIEFEQINVDKSQWTVGFQRDGQIHKTGKGDEQRVFATVLSAIKEFIENKQPKEVFFSAEKSEVNPESRKSLYDRLVQKYATALGYQASQSETNWGTKYKFLRIREQGVAEGKVINTYLWHGSRQKIPILEPRQAVDTGGAAGSNQNAIYATSDPIFATQMGMPAAGSDYGHFPNDPQMVLFSGKIRKGEYVYLHKLPFNGPDGKPQFVRGGNNREFHSIPGIEGIKPIEIKKIPVNKYLNLIRKATPTDWKLRKKYMKQGVAEENLKEFAPGPDFRDDDDRQDMPLLEFAKIIKLFLGSEYTMIDRKTPEQVSVKFYPKDRTSGHNGAVLYSIIGKKQNEYPTVNFQLIDYEQGPQVGRGRRAGTAIPKTRTNALKIADMIYNTMGLPQQDRRVEENFPDGKHTAGNYRLQEAGPLKIAGQVAAAHSSANDVVSRFQRGDYAGAGIGALSAIANLKPGLGTAVSLGLDYINDQRDKQNSVANLNKPEVQSGTANDEIKPINPDAAMQENFADGRNPGRKGLAKRMGVPTKASVTRLRQIAKSSSGEKQRMAHWMANMKAGKKK